MTSRDFSNWMWGEALSMIERAERLQRQFFQHATSVSAVAWEPPVDILESAEELRVQIALPGVPAEAISVALDPGGLHIAALRTFPCRDDTTNVHRLEIPYGRFERHVGLPLGDPYVPLEMVDRKLADGVLTLVFRKKEGA